MLLRVHEVLHVHELRGTRHCACNGPRKQRTCLCTAFSLLRSASSISCKLHSAAQHRLDNTRTLSFCSCLRLLSSSSSSCFRCASSTCQRGSVSGTGSGEEHGHLELLLLQRLLPLEVRNGVLGRGLQGGSWTRSSTGPPTSAFLALSRAVPRLP